jgi:hypothetical protein
MLGMVTVLGVDSVQYRAVISDRAWKGRESGELRFWSLSGRCKLC